MPSCFPVCPNECPYANGEGLLVHPIRTIARLGLVTLLLATPANPRAQTTPPATNSSPTTPTGTPNTVLPVLRSNTNLVLVDVVVTDHGNTVYGLDRSRFHVLEDGREQPITTFDERRPTASSVAASASQVQSALPPNTYTNASPYPPSSAVNVLLLDALNTSLANQMDVRRQMIQFLGDIAPGTSLAIFTLSSRLRLVDGFTTDAAQLTRVLKSPKGTPQQPVILDPQTDQAVDSIVGDMANMTGGTGSPTVAGVTPISALQQFQADTTAFQTDMRVQMTLEAMQQLARYLGGIPGRKNVIWFSGSFPIALDPDISQDNLFSSLRNYSDDIRDTAELLSAARVAVYPVDARGLMTLPSLDASYSPSTNLMGATVNGGRNGKRARAGANKPSPGIDDQKALQQIMAEQASMKQLAEQTGGQDYINTNGLKDAVASAIANGSSYYTVGYVPTAGQLDGRFHKIQVNVDNRDLKLAYRHGYYADAPDRPSAHSQGATSLVVAAALRGAPPSTQILFQARVLPANDPLFKGSNLPAGSGGELTSTLKGPLQRFIVDLTIDAHGFVYDLAPDGALHSKAEFMLVAYDADGHRVNYLDSGFQLSLKPGQIAQTVATGIRIRLPIDLPHGQFSLRIAVHDLAAGRAGSLELPVAVSGNLIELPRAVPAATSVRQ